MAHISLFSLWLFRISSKPIVSPFNNRYTHSWHRELFFAVDGVGKRPSYPPNFQPLKSHQAGPKLAVAELEPFK